MRSLRRRRRPEHHWTDWTEPPAVRFRNVRAFSRADARPEPTEPIEPKPPAPPAPSEPLNQVQYHSAFSITLIGW